MTTNEMKKLRDKVANAGARVARAQLNLELAQQDLDAARKHVVEAAKAGRERFDVYLTSYGTNKIQVIKAVREIASLGLKEAKDVTDFAGSNCMKQNLVRSNVDQLDVQWIKQLIQTAGGAVCAMRAEQ